MNAHAPLNPTSLEISAYSRAAIREAIKGHPDWSDYRRENDTDMAQMATKEALIRCCNALNIDIAAIIRGEAGYLNTTEAQTKAATRAPDLLGQTLDLTPTKAPQQRPQKAATIGPHKGADMLAEALRLIAAETNAPVDMSQVEEAMNAKADQITDTFFKHLTDFGRDLDEKLAAMQANAPRHVIELRAPNKEARTIEGAHHPKFATMLKVLSCRQGDGFAPNIWIAGPAGSGKTHAAKTAAKALEVPFHYNGALSMPHELLGFIDAGGNYHRTPFRDAYESGGVYLFDEVDGSDNSALLALNAALANGTATFPDGQITRHADCYIIATANTWGLGATAEYVGRSKIDAAFLSRFPVRIGWDYDTELEQAISGNKAFAKQVQKAREKAKNAGLKVLIDPRATMAGAALVAGPFTPAEAAELTYLANLSADQRRMIEG